MSENLRDVCFFLHLIFLTPNKQQSFAAHLLIIQWIQQVWMCTVHTLYFNIIPRRDILLGLFFDFDFGPWIIEYTDCFLTHSTWFMIQNFPYFLYSIASYREVQWWICPYFRASSQVIIWKLKHLKRMETHYSEPSLNPV